MVLGAAILGGYGLIVNSIDWDFAKIFGVYVGAFALVAILFGKFLCSGTGSGQHLDWAADHHQRRVGDSVWEIGESQCRRRKALRSSVMAARHDQRHDERGQWE